MLSGANSVGRPSMLFMFFRRQYLRKLTRFNAQIDRPIVAFG